MGEITWGTAAAALAMPFVLILPGWALLSLLLPAEIRARLDAAAWLALAVGLTLAMTPVGLLLLDLVGLRLGPAAVLAVLGLSAAVVAWRQLPGWRAGWRRRGWRERLAWLDGPLVAWLAVAALALGVRLWVVRGVNIGFWGDSFQHTLITQLILDNGGLFDSWEPYAPLTTFTYHFGFHGNVALLQWATGWLTGNATPRTVVLMGQFLNALAALALYPLAVRLSGGRRWAGVVAVLVAGLLTPMPMYYTNWGRYTQLAGQAILPAALWLSLEALEAERLSIRQLALAVLAVTGLALTHYFVLAFYVLFWLPYLAAWAVRHWRRRRLLLSPWLRLSAIGGLAILLLLPWVWRVAEGLLPRILGGYLQGTPDPEFVRAETQFYPLRQFLPYAVAALAGLGGLWALARRQGSGLLLLWTGCLILLANPHWLALPGRGVINNFTVELALYIPAAILCGDLVASAVDLVGRRLTSAAAQPRAWPRVAALALAVPLVAGIAWTGVKDRSIGLDPQFQLVTPADEQALAWVRAATPTDSRFLVNSFFAYGGSLIAGSDAGWWLPLLTGRANTLPPLNYGSEAGPDPGYGERVNAMAHRLEQSRLDDPATVRYLREQGVTHVFVGEKGGKLLDPALMLGSPLYRAVYAPGAGSGGPWVFEVLEP